ncbi:MAG: serine/arginine repetitive matrix protein 2 [Lachnospiraceae bacterium]|nr:serine/arginine repetitive matrix protein 2 [Lachnospiraceae bacterium]
MKLTRHNGRCGKHGTYNPKHNDRRFDVDNSDHINPELTKQNIYWDCINGFTTPQDHQMDKDGDISFEDVELLFYTSQYTAFINAQNERNIKSRHANRNRSVEDLLKNKKTCPEETIYQIGNMDESVPPEILLQITTEFLTKMRDQFGEHVHILNWALHLDEKTPHIQERHVFDCKNQYGEICPQQEKALEALGIELPDPTQPRSKFNNRKQTFDAICRSMLFDICEQHGVHLDREPEYGGRSHMEKNDFILAKQKSAIAEKEQALNEITMKLEDAETLVEEIVDTAYEKACETVAEKVFEETQKQDLAIVENYQTWISSKDRNLPTDKKNLIIRSLDAVQNRIKKSAEKLRQKVMSALKSPSLQEQAKALIKEKAKESLLEKLQRNKTLIKRAGDSEKKTKQKNMER